MSHFRVGLVVARGCGDLSQQSLREEHSLALRVAQGQNVDVLQTTATHSRTEFLDQAAKNIPRAS